MTVNLYENDAYLKDCSAEITSITDHGIVLDQSVFYCTGGGQPGDSGILKIRGDSVKITNTIRDKESGEVIHMLEKNTPGSLEVGMQVHVEIDWDRRYQHMKMHSCLHLLCSLIDAAVTGCSISNEKGRLDFDLPEQSIDKADITAKLNKLIKENHDVGVYWISDEDLDKNPELVRTMSVKPPAGNGRVRIIDIKNTDIQPCGGTHVAKTGEIGFVKVVKVQKKSKHNRRVAIAFA